MNDMLKEVTKKSLTTDVGIEDIMPVGDKILVVIKSWPAQTLQGIIVPDSFSVIKGEKYIAEVLRVGEDITIVKKGDAVIVSMYSGHHVATKTGFGKIISETDIIAHKKESNMILDPETFKPGMNYILVKITKEKEIVTEGGIVLQASMLNNDSSKQDVSTTTGEVIAIGETNEYGKKFNQVNVGTKIIFDSYVGLDLPTMEASGDTIYKVMFAQDILGIVKK
jgi:co-chaperonin GroES (HSP10)